VFGAVSQLAIGTERAAGHLVSTIAKSAMTSNYPKPPFPAQKQPSNAVAPDPIWTPLIPSPMPDNAVKNFGKQVPMKRPGQPAELATAYVMLADRLSSYTSGTTIAETGGKPFI
jgi:Enoyl-(Acyl carrier protein) reductase